MVMKKITLTLIVALVIVALATPAVYLSAKAYSGIPTFSIVSVVTDEKVTILTTNFPASYDFQVLIGAYGTKGVGGVEVTTTNSGSGGAFEATYAIPASLQGSQKLAIRLQNTASGFYAYNWFTNTTAASTTPSTYKGFPTFSITSVVVDTSVTVGIANLPASYTFNVLMGAYGTLGIGGTKVASFDSGTGGALAATYDIPDALKGKQRIAIRLESTTGGFYAYNWLWNNTSTVPSTSYSGIPTISIDSVVVDSKVTIKGVNFPAGFTFDVLMGSYGTLGIGGTKVTTFDSGTGGNFTATYDVPASLKGAQRIAIRLQSETGSYYAYNWFWNNTSTTSSGTVYTGIPTITITGVSKDTTITVSAKNFPANVDFVVLVGNYGTLGVGGTKVADFNSGAGGNFTATYNIPSAVQGMSKIAIRIQSTNGIFFAYNWFWNSNA
jgi:hypothetical protein